MAQAMVENEGYIEEDGKEWWQASPHPDVYYGEKEIDVPAHRKETAWGGCLDGVGDAWWHYLQIDEIRDPVSGKLHPVASTETIWADQYIDVGTVTYDPRSGTIRLNLKSGWQLQNIPEPVKIQGYDVLPERTPRTGSFNTYKGKETTVKVNPYSYYAIHLDLHFCS